MTVIPDLRLNGLPTRTACLVNNGCPDSRADAAHVREYLIAMGYTITKRVSEADLVLFFACGLTHHGEAISLAIVEGIDKQLKPGAQLVVGGCLPVINPQPLAKIYQGPIFGPHPLTDLTELTDSKIDVNEIIANDQVTSHVPISIPRRLAVDIRNQNLLFTAQRAWYTIGDAVNRGTAGDSPDAFTIQIAIGCSHRCAYCVVPICRGMVRSKPIERVLAEFDRGLAEGHKVFALLASDAGSYGRDIGTDLVHLLDAMLQRQGDYVVRVRNCQPRYTVDHLDELMTLFDSGRIPFFASTIQSGSDRILKLMRRGHRVQELEEAMLAIHERFPEMQLRTQAMAAFPTETEAEFQQTLDYLDRVPHDYVEAYMFQARPGTRAYEMDGQIPLSVGSRRLIRLQWKAFTSRLRR